MHSSTHLGQGTSQGMEQGQDPAGMLMNHQKMGELSIRNSQLNENELVNEMVDSSHFKCQGVLMQFINNNAPDSATIIGGLRIAINDVRRLPGYICKYRQRIKTHAIDCLQRHLRETVCSIGADEELSPDDFGISFMMASVSPIGRALHPNRRNEGAMFYCMYPPLLDEVYLYLATDATPITAQVVNAYIHLLEPSRRRTYVLKRHRKEQLRKKEAQAVAATTAAIQPAKPAQKSSSEPPAKKKKKGSKRPKENQQGVDKSLVAVVAQLSGKIEHMSGVMPTTANFPVMPEASKVWPSASPIEPLPDQ